MPSCQKQTQYKSRSRPFLDSGNSRRGCGDCTIDQCRSVFASRSVCQPTRSLVSAAATAVCVPPTFTTHRRRPSRYYESFVLVLAMQTKTRWRAMDLITDGRHTGSVMGTTPEQTMQYRFPLSSCILLSTAVSASNQKRYRLLFPVDLFATCQFVFDGAKQESQWWCRPTAQSDLSYNLFRVDELYKFIKQVVL